MKKNNILIIAALTFFVLLLVVFNEFVFDNSKLMLNSDQLNGIGSRYVRAENVILPEWDDSRLGGVPTYEALFADVYHPLTIVYFILDPDRATGFKFILTILVAFISAFILGRYLTGKWQWAALLGFLYAFSPQYFTYIYGGHDGKMMVFAIAPFAMYALKRLLNEGSLKHGIYLCLSIVWMILSSHLQLSYFFLWGAGLYALFEIFNQKLSAKIKTLRLGLAGIVLVIALMISAFQIIPPYLYTTTSSVRGSTEKTTIEHSASWSLHGEELAAMILPGFLGTDVNPNSQNSYWGQNPFKLNADSVGILLTFLALCGLLLPNNRKESLFWFFGCVIALSYAMGLHSFLFNLWFNFIPGVKNFRAPSMAVFWLPLTFLFLAAPVLKNIEENKEHIKKAAILFGILLVAVLIFRFAWESLNGAPVALFIVLFGAYFIKLSEPKLSELKNFEDKKLILRVILWFIPFLIMAGFFLKPVVNDYFKPVNFIKASELSSFAISSFVVAAIVLASAFFILSNVKNLTNIILILMAFAAIDLAIVDLPYIQTVRRNAYYNPKHPIIQAIKQDSPNSLETPRIFSLTRNPAISGNNLASYNLRNALGFHDNEIATYRVFKENLQNQAMLDLMNVGYIIFENERGSVGIQKNTSNIGQAKMYYKWQQLENQAKIIEQLKDNNFNYRDVLLLEEATVQLEQNNNSNASIQNSVKIIANNMDEISFEVESSESGMLFVSENFQKNWKAKVNEQNVPIQKAFSTFMAIPIEKGKAIVEFKYESDYLKYSFYIGVCGIVCLFGFGLIVLKQRKSNVL